MVVEGMGAIERESFSEWLADPTPERTPDPDASAVDDEDWGADPDAQARMEAAMAMMGGVDG